MKNPYHKYQHDSTEIYPLFKEMAENQKEDVPNDSKAPLYPFRHGSSYWGLEMISFMKSTSGCE